MAKNGFASKLAKEILLASAALTAAAGITITLAVFPGMGKVMKELLDWYQKSDKTTRYRIRKTFAALRKKRLIEEEELSDGTVKLVLSEKGKRRVLQYKVDDLKINIPKNEWDKKWRMVIFDLPKRYKREREFWRHKLKIWGFYQLQKSVWIFPYPCRNEIDFITEYLKISPYVRLVEVTDFDGSKEIKDFFSASLSKPLIL